MKKLIIVVMLTIFATGLMAQAETLSTDQTEIRLLIKTMYAIDPDTFEFAEFGAKYKNDEVVVEGKYDPDRQCILFAEYLVKEAIIRNKRAKQGCMTGVYGFFRYPSYDSMDLSSATRTSAPPAPHIGMPDVNGDKAKVHVTFPINGTNVMYYLRKMPVGWRIYRVESSENSATIDTMSQGDTVSVFPPDAPSK